MRVLIRRRHRGFFLVILITFRDESGFSADESIVWFRQYRRYFGSQFQRICDFVDEDFISAFKYGRTGKCDENLRCEKLLRRWLYSVAEVKLDVLSKLQSFYRHRTPKVG